MIPKKLGDLFVNVSSKGVEATNAKLGMTEKKATMASKAAGMLKAALLGIGVYAVIRGLKSVIDEFTDYTVKIDKFTKQTGMATSAIQRLVYAAEQEHASLESLNKGLMNLTVRLGYAGDGLETYLRYFRALGIEYRRADGTLRNTHDVFLDIADVVEKGTLSTEELAAVLQLFGARSGKELIPLLKKGRDWFELMGDEAERLGIVLDEKTIKAGKAFSDQMTASGAAARGLKYNLAEVLLPALNMIVKALTKAAAGWRAFLGGGDAKEIENQNKLIASSLKRYKEWLDKGIISQKQYGIAIKKLIKLQQQWKSGMEGTIPAIDDLGIATETTAEFTQEMRDEYQEMLKLEELRAAAIWEMVKGYGELTQHQKDLIDMNPELEENKNNAIEQAKSATDMIDFETAALQTLGAAFMNLDQVLLDNSYSFADWGEQLVKSLIAVGIQLLALAAIIGFLEALGVPAGALISAGSKMGLFQTPTGDAFAYREGRDMGKFFFEGFGERLKQMTSNINVNQQPVNVIVHTGDPSTFVEFVSKMPSAHKSKFHREVTEKARLLEG